jgi:heme/copper-type cytochrome/quinol oxidase subunit 2
MLCLCTVSERLSGYAMQLHATNDRAIEAEVCSMMMMMMMMMVMVMVMMVACYWGGLVITPPRKRASPSPYSQLPIIGTRHRTAILH